MSDSKLSVEFFRNLLESETKNLNSLSDKWSKVLSEQQACDDDQEKEKEEFQGAIRTTIGQAKLLMSQRFKQFSKLIDDCEFERGPLPTRLEDLAGFWEMINYQVDDVRQKFQSLEEMY